MSHRLLARGEVRKNLLGFGVRTPKYRKVEWPPFPEYESVGRWESAYYDPEEWRNDYPNPAFVRMSDRDAFWAAKIIMRFTPEELRAIVEAGELSDPVQQQYFLDVLIERQRKTARPYLNRLNPLDRFAVTPEGLRFINLSEEYSFAEAGTTYRVQWSVYDNAADTTRPLGEAVTQTATTIRLPDASAVVSGRELFLMAQVHALHDAHPMWNRSVAVYLRPRGGTFEVVGIDRESDPPDAEM